MVSPGLMVITSPAARIGVPRSAGIRTEPNGVDTHLGGQIAVSYLVDVCTRTSELPA